MKPQLKPLDQQVIVITGASSGIGLATAKMAAQAGARLVLVARNEEALREVEKNLNAGDRVMHVVADVGKREDLERVASDTIRHFGHFDTWINNAGSSVWGRFDEVELQKSGAPVSVTLVRPPAIDTLFNDHAKNALPSAATFPPPVYAPEVVAQAILHAAEHPQRDVYIGNAKMFTRMAQLAPGFTDWISRSALYDMLQSGRGDSHRQGALHNEDVGDVVDGRTSGNYPGKVLQSSLYTRIAQKPKTAAASALGALAMAALVVRRMR